MERLGQLQACFYWGTSLAMVLVTILIVGGLGLAAMLYFNVKVTRPRQNVKWSDL